MDTVVGVIRVAQAAAAAPVIRVLVVDDDPLVRMGLRMVLDGAGGIAVVAEGADGTEAVALAAEHAPDLILLDIRMPVMDGLAATVALHALPLPPKVVILTTFNPDEYVLAALRAGAAGFLLKDTPPADIITAVRRVAAGEPVLSPAVTHQVITRATAPAPAPRPDPGRTSARERLRTLAPREHEVALAVAQGRTNAEIAAALYLSVPTVKSHVSAAMAKLGLTNRVQIAILVHEADLGHPPRTA
ncbi:response regulator [Streptomyces sp. NPDC058525]